MVTPEILVINVHVAHAKVTEASFLGILSLLRLTILESLFLVYEYLCSRIPSFSRVSNALYCAFCTAGHL